MAMRRPVLSCVLAAICAWFATGTTPGAQAKRAATLVDLLNIPRIADPQISRDGRQILFTLLTTDWPGNRRIPQIWQIGADGTRLHRLTSVDTGAFAARWSPDGSTIAFLSRVGAVQQISLMPARGGGARALSKHATGIADFAWHPDGTSIYFLANNPPTDADRARAQLRGDMKVLDEFVLRHLWRISIADGKEIPITSGDYHVLSFRIASNGQRIILNRRPTPLPADTDKMEVWSIAPDGSDPIRLTKNNTPEDEGDLSPDGTQVLFLARANERQESYYNENLFIVPARGGAARLLMPGYAHEVLRASWDPDGKSIWMIVNTGVRIDLFQVDLATRTPRRATTGDHAVVPQSWQMAGGRHVFMVDEPTRIGDIWTLGPQVGNATRVTGIYDYLDRTFALPRQELVEWKGADGVRIEGILSYPIDYTPGERYPLIVQLHGGPEASDRFGWGSIFFNIQPAWTARGYAILRPNYRGSSGYGTAFYREPVGGYFKNSHLDVLTGVDSLIAKGIVDPERIGISGWSAGAHIVNKLITYTARFKAASSGAGAANWISMYGQSDTHSERDLWLGGSIWQKNAPIQTYWDHSPLKYVAAARTPTVFFAGENDTRVPMAQSIEMQRALRGLGVPSELHIAPNEPHQWQQPRHELYKMNVEIEWFEKYVRKLPYMPENPPAANDPTVLPTP